MDINMLQKLKEDLAEAVNKKDYAKIKEISAILNISKEQSQYFDSGLTGFPSIDKPWLKYYSEGAEERALNIPVNKTVWDVIEEKLLEYYDIPALEYFGREFSKQEFIDLCYTWARTFRAMGVEENEVVPIYGPFVPDICAMVFALNMIGACPYFLKLAISKEALAEETIDSKIAVVYDGMWKNVREEFSKDRFKNVIVASVSADMPSPKKQIISFISKMQSIKEKSQIPSDKKYIWADKARDIANYYGGNVKVPFEPNRSTFITSSSGTTIGGIVKGTVATNESTISQLYMGEASETNFFPGDRCLNHFPPTASTSLNLLFLTALYSGETIILDPRVSEKDFYNQLINLKPNQALNTGSAWEAFFNRVSSEMKKGKKFDFSYAKGWTVGGEGTDVKTFALWNEIMKNANAKNELFIGYGLSELFSAATASKLNAYDGNAKQIMSVGIPYAGIIMSIFDENGNELSYNQRGEIRIKSKSAMKEYYKKPKKTSEILVDGWVHTGDEAEIDENGFIYVWGRKNDSIKLSDGSIYYLFDIANLIKKAYFVKDAIVLNIPTLDNPNNLVAHVVLDESYSDYDYYYVLLKLNEILMCFLPEELSISAYAFYNNMLLYSPTTLKKDRNKMASQTKDFYQIVDGNLNKIDFSLNDDGKIVMKYAIIKKDKVKVHSRK